MKRITIGLGREFNRHGDKIPDEVSAGLRKAMITEATARFGGVTILDTVGAWRDGSGQVVMERGYTVQVLVDHAGDAFVKGRAFANWVRGTFYQTSVVFLVEDVQGWFVEGV